MTLHAPKMNATFCCCWTPFYGGASETKVSAYNEGVNNGSAKRSEVRPTDRQVMPEASEAATVEQQADDPF